MKRSGFVLFEYVIAFICAAMLIFMVSSVFSALYVRLSHYSAGCIATIAVARAYFLLERDLAHAPADLTSWKKRSPSECIFSTSAGDCGWLLKRDRLVRTKGFYNQNRGVWSDAHESVALLDVKHFAIQCITSNNQVQGCNVVLESKDQHVAFWVACCHDRSIAVNKNRILV